MSGGELALIAWCDLVGLLRTRPVPLDRLAAKSRHGLGWAAAGLAITPFDGIVDNPFGPVDEFRQIPVPGASVSVAATERVPALHLHLCRTLDRNGGADCCPRSVCEQALAELHDATGWSLMSAFEHEFTVLEAPFRFGHVYSVESVRLAAQFAHDVTAALRPLGLECFEPEFGKGQFEASCEPFAGVAGADRAILTREVIREIGRRHGVRLTFSPKPEPQGVGNGLHVHFSFQDDRGRNVLYDPGRPGMVAETAAHFIGGMTRYMAAITALCAPAPVSYLRLGPSHWSCGYSAFGVQNREAALRVCLSPDPSPAAAAAATNLELRAPDSTCNPYLALTALVRAGLQGIRDALPLPPIVNGDPAELGEAERDALGVRPLPATLGEALDALDGDPITRGWLPPRLHRTFMSIKRMEIERFATASPEEIARTYRELY